MAKRPQKRSGDLQAPALNAPQLGVTSQPVDTRVTPAANAPQAPQLLPEPAKPDMQGARDLENMGRALGDLSKTLFGYAQVSKERRTQEKKDTRDEALRRLREGAKPFEEMQKKGDLTGATPPQLKGVSIAYGTYAVEQAMLDWQQQVETLRADPGYLKADGWQSHLSEILQKRYNEFAGLVKAGGRPDAFNRAFNRLAKNAQDRVQADHARWLQGAAEDKRQEGVRGEIRMILGNALDDADSFDLTTPQGEADYARVVTDQLNVLLQDGYGQTYSEDAYPTVFGKALIDLAAMEDSVTEIALFALSNPDLGDLLQNNQEVREYFFANENKINDVRLAGRGRTAQAQVTGYAGTVEARLLESFGNVFSVDGRGKDSLPAALGGDPIAIISGIMEEMEQGSTNNVTFSIDASGLNVTLQSVLDPTKTATINIKNAYESARQTAINNFIGDAGPAAEALAADRFGTIPRSVAKIQSGIAAIRSYTPLDDPEANANALRPIAEAYDLWAAYNTRMHSRQLTTDAGVGEQGELLMRAIHMLVRQPENALTVQNAAARVSDRFRRLEQELPSISTGATFSEELAKRVTPDQEENGDDLVIKRLAQVFMFLGGSDNAGDGLLITPDQAITDAMEFLESQTFFVGGSRQYYANTPIQIEDTRRVSTGDYTNRDLELAQRLLGSEKPEGLIVEGIAKGHVGGFLTEDMIAEYSEGSDKFKVRAFVPADSSMTSFRVEMKDDSYLDNGSTFSIAQLMAYKKSYQLKLKYPKGPPDPEKVRQGKELAETLAIVDALDDPNAREEARRQAFADANRRTVQRREQAKKDAADEAEREKIQRDFDNAFIEEGMIALLSTSREGRTILADTLSLSGPDVTVLQQVAPDDFGDLQPGEVTLPAGDALTALRRFNESRLPQAKAIAERKGGLPELARRLYDKDFRGNPLQDDNFDLRMTLTSPAALLAYQDLSQEVKEALGENFAWMGDASVPLPEVFRERALVEGKLGTMVSRLFSGPNYLGRAIGGSEGSVVESMILANMIAEGDTEEEIENVILRRFGYIEDGMVLPGEQGNYRANAGRRAVLVRRMLAASPEGRAELRRAESQFGDSSPNKLKTYINRGEFLTPEGETVYGTFPFKTEGAYRVYAEMTDEERRILGNPFSFMADPRSLYPDVFPQPEPKEEDE